MNTSMAPAQGGGPPAVTLRASGVELSTLVPLLTGLAGRPVIDRTGLTGGYDFEVTFSLAQARALTTALPGGGGLGAPAGLSATGGLGAPPPGVVDDGPLCG
jgi:uncharacterized protein (TIGR03435 family)